VRLFFCHCSNPAVPFTRSTQNDIGRLTVFVTFYILIWRCEKARRVQTAMNFPAEKTITVVLRTNAAAEIALELHASAAL
jgi:type II secretory pathway component PulM